MHVPPVENPACAAFKEYEEVPETVPLDFTEDYVWRRLAAQSASWYATPSGAVGRRFTEILAADWRGVLNRSWNSGRSLVFAHVVLTKTLGVCRAREIRARITRSMNLWERGQHAGQVGQVCLRRRGGGQSRSKKIPRKIVVG